MKLFILSISLFFLSPAYSQVERKGNNSFELLVKINNLGRNYVGCGVMKYSITVTGLVQNQADKIKFGDSVVLIFTCPETLNSLPTGQFYKLEVEFSNDRQENNIKTAGAKITAIRPRLNVLSSKIVFNTADAQSLH
ncbi:MAG: hypothetical protein ABL872_06520 [Lacibacter sp.]